MEVVDVVDGANSEAIEKAVNKYKDLKQDAETKPEEEDKNETKAFILSLPELVFPRQNIISSEHHNNLILFSSSNS